MFQLRFQRIQIFDASLKHNIQIVGSTSADSQLSIAIPIKFPAPLVIVRSGIYHPELVANQAKPAFPALKIQDNKKTILKIDFK